MLRTKLVGNRGLLLGSLIIAAALCPALSRADTVRAEEDTVTVVYNGDKVTGTMVVTCR